MVNKHVTGPHAEARPEHINSHKMAHMVGVAEYMRCRAEDYGLDKDIAYMLGLMHDIGFLYGQPGHEEKGMELLNRFGAKSLLVHAVHYHGVNPYHCSKKNLKKCGYNVDKLRQCGEVPYEEISKDFKNNPYLTLLYEADVRVDANGNACGFRKRLEDIKNRLGEDSAPAKSVKRITDYVFEYCRDKGIAEPPSMKEMEKRHREVSELLRYK